MPINTQLFIPNVVSSNVHNWYGIAPSYNEALIVGSFYPYLPLPPPMPLHKHRPFWKMFVEIAVGAAILCFAPELAPIFGPLFAFLGGMVGETLLAGLPAALAYGLAGGVMGIASNIASQETARLFGDEDHFSWKAMWTSGIENAFTAGMSQFLGIPNPALKQQFITSVLHSEELAAGMQVVLLLTHRENHFDWKALITAAVQPVVNLEIQTYVPPIADNVLQQVVLTFTDDIISSSIATHVLNRESLEYAAADALGSATGNLIHQKLVEIYQTLQTKLEYSAYQAWVKQQANLAERIQELKEKQARLDEELKRIEAKNKAFTNNTDTSNKNKRNHTEDNNSNTKKNPSYEKRTQDHEQTTSRARRWSQNKESFSLKKIFFDSLENLVEMDKKTQEGFEDIIVGRTHDAGNNFFDELGYGIGVDMGLLMQAVTGEELLAGLGRGYSALSRFWRTTNSIDEKNSISNPLIEALNDAKPTPGKTNQLETTLSDGSKVIFRRDIGEYAHPLGKNQDPIDHFNVEVHLQDSSRPGRYIPSQNMHIIVDSELNPTEIIFKETEPFNNNFPNNSI